MFRKALKKDKEGTRNERHRSKSMENICEDGACDPNVEERRSRGATAIPAYFRQNTLPGWKEISSVKALNPVVTCLLPALSMDFVASSLLAIGATPLITEGMQVLMLI